MSQREAGLTRWCLSGWWNLLVPQPGLLLVTALPTTLQLHWPPFSLFLLLALSFTPHSSRDKQLSPSFDETIFSKCSHSSAVSEGTLAATSISYSLLDVNIICWHHTRIRKFSSFQLHATLPVTQSCLPCQCFTVIWHIWKVKLDKLAEI